MTPRRPEWIALVLSCLLVACGGGSDSPADPDVGGDGGSGGGDVGVTDSGLSPDVADDAADDAAVDASLDAGEDVAADAEVDGADDASNDAADGSGEPDVDEWPFDCPRPECATDDECGEGVCIGGACAETTTPEAFAPSALGYVSRLSVGTLEEPCCFDLDGDEALDNTAADLLALYYASSEAPDFQASIDDLLMRGLYPILTSYTALDETSGVFAMLGGDADLDSDGNADSSGEARANGEGAFQIDARTFGANGPELQLYSGILESGDRCSSPTDLAIVTPLPYPCPFRWDEEQPAEDGTRCRGEEEHPLSFSELRIEGPIEVDQGAVTTPEGGAIRVGGYVHLDAFAQVMNISYGDNCACVGLGRDGDLVEWSTATGEFEFSCTLDVGEEELANCSEFQRQCQGIDGFCSALSLLGGLAEYDSDGDGVDDSISFGFEVELAAATLAEAQPAPVHELCANGVDDDGDALADCDDAECWDDTNCGANGWGEQCNNGVDDDGDDAIDCDDSNCSTNIACQVDEGSGEGSGE